MTQTDPSPHARDDMPDPTGVLTVGYLLRELQEAVTDRRLSPDAAVVVATDGWYDELSTDLGDPSESDNLIWFTLSPCGPADARFTSGHYTEERDEDDTNEPVVDLVGRLFAQFWTDPRSPNYKAGDYDACRWVAEQAYAIRPGLTWSDAAVRRAADLSYVLGQYGLDQATDRVYHAVMAATIFETEDV